MALDVATEIHECMAADFNAYIWWYIRRYYGPITDNGQVSKRGYMMAQYSKFVRPGFVRVDAVYEGGGWGSSIKATAYKSGRQVAVVIVNTGTSSQTLSVGVNAGSFSSFKTYTSSGSKNVSNDGTVALTDNAASVTLDAQSVTTFVSE